MTCKYPKISVEFMLKWVDYFAEMMKLLFSYRGTYCSQDVAIKVLKPERLNVEMQREFAQEVYIMRFELISICFFCAIFMAYL